MRLRFDRPGGEAPGFTSDADVLVVLDSPEHEDTADQLRDLTCDVILDDPADEHGFGPPPAAGRLSIPGAG